MLEDPHHGRDRLAAKVSKRPGNRVVHLGDQRARLMYRQRDLE
jgi:hypothetical protein